MSVDRLLFYCPDARTASGGVETIYRHVAILNESGFNAAVVHTRPGFRCAWLSTRAPVLSRGGVSAGNRDVVVLPEIWAGGVHDFNALTPIIIFNQNGYYTFPNGNEAQKALVQAAYKAENVAGVLTISDDTYALVGRLLPGLRRYRVRLGIDTQLFAPPAFKERIVSYLPRKNPEHSRAVLDSLATRGVLDRFDTVPIDGLSRAGVADVLRRSAVFLSFGHPEGLGLPAAEAMLCGCLVIGYHGGGGREFWKTTHSYAIEFGHLDRLVDAATAAIAGLGSETQLPVSAFGHRAASFVRQHLDPEAERASVVSTWTTILSDVEERR